ncbi:ATPase family protein associated with various cellular activities (AAA) [Brevibacterium sanguinis]|uniref:ATPase family protein associated with various cellular activities (AAA) n=2 Tax=Brevibacterium TaxID=1696 RepID=A0A366IPF0_9MICO|nr:MULTISPECIES: AAA family ATPase [Brevibacterium]RBP67864.1 ATPase family protein associated with various cellular activities (AAA) [Brevibacterium sanguinis]RBP74719.1 ATPase family protein associated with various cellular activities (AAA) [Brevibacterium celere]
MSRTRVRDFHDDDLDGVIRLWEAAMATPTAPVYSLPEVIASCQVDHAVVAVRDDEVVGAAVGRAAHAQGWIVFFHVLDAAHGSNGRGSTGAGERDEHAEAALLDALERRLMPLGLGKLSMIVPEHSSAFSGLENNGFEVRSHLRYLERQMPVQRRELDLLKAVGGRILPRHLWDAVSGMQEEKDMLEERLVVPLSEPDLADHFGVVPPRAVMLFGPPGTGKTTFAKAVASRLDWPFVELFPSRLSGEPGGVAAGLRTSFEQIGELEHAVVFIDEVEEIASKRGGEPPSPTQGVTNELLKQVAEFRDREGRLLICATNFVRALDAAFLRHGRFDYVIPIGLPDETARKAIWTRYVPDQMIDGIDLDQLAEASAGLTPADIEYAARRASQEALARALVKDHVSIDSRSEALTTENYMEALRATRATVSEETVREFREDVQTIARL